MVFVYGINRSELIKSIQSLYGDIDAQRYIRRFFDMNFTLPPADDNTKKYIEWLLDKYQISTSDRIDRDVFKESAQRVIGSNMSLSLRDIEHCVRFAALVVSKWQLDPISIVRDYDKVSTEDVYDAVMAIIVR